MQLRRRDVLKTLVSLSGVAALGDAAIASSAWAAADLPDLPAMFAKFGLVVNPRSAWVPASAPVPKGLKNEEKVNVLLVHHSDSPNTYAQAKVPGMLGGFRAFHTGEKGWPDIAYNFFVDRFGGVWEGRYGSLTGPVAGSATGGNQGHSQLICLVGTHTKEPPSGAALESLAKLLAALEEAYGLSADPEATTSFVSQGSNKWKAGKTVTLRSIEGHRATSMTDCPGDAAFAALPAVRLKVQKLRRG